ncbi:MAG TPA: hypothetical protein VHK69_00410 [Chitinophagaceae bacterium]|jgi:hypothetical protein|nr:hypothetical protein [Chitinophagaceae bacterium]
MTTNPIYEAFHSRFSLQPLVSVLKKMIAEGKPGARKLYEDLLKEIAAVPELLEPVESPAALTAHRELVESLLSAIFPPSTADTQGVHAISFPFRPEVVYASPGFAELFLPEGTDKITVPDTRTNVNIARASVRLAYNVILQKLYALPVTTVASSVHPFTDPDTGLIKYLELKLNAQFVTVKCINKDFSLPASFSPQRTLDVEELKEAFPLEYFQFEGLVVIDVADVTSEQVITDIKNALLNINMFSDTTVYDNLQLHVQTLMGLKDVQVGITPFFKKNNYFLYTEAHYRNSLLFRNEQVIAQKEAVSTQCQHIFRNTDQPLLYQSLNEHNSSGNEVVRYYYETGARSLILCPLKCDDGDLIGLLEVVSPEPGRLRFHHIARMQSAMPLFSLALEKSNENLELQIDKTIKEHFTAIQSAVEWKFTEAAFDYLQNRQVSDAARMPAIMFEDVYPLYGAIDVRNSSVERNNAIQLDLMEQLDMARAVLEKAGRIMQFPLLKEIRFKIDKYIASVSDTLLSDDELLIYDFLQINIDALFRHLHASKPELRKAVDDYYAALDPSRKIIFHHRKDYEESITRINDVLDRFIDQEQKMAQQTYPHYFERYITDGIEFNMYVGQSLAPSLPFHEVYVSNLKLWQLTMLARAARLTHSLEKKLSLPLQTTQLILAHSLPLSISFRRKERKFDVDGAYNIRYEIIKKRIDKVHIKETDERLTQPGTIAIVYSQQKELNEYQEYIEYLQHEGFLGDNVEHFELEDTQGISGLRALRVDINLNAETANPPAAVRVEHGVAKPVMRK